MHTRQGDGESHATNSQDFIAHLVHVVMAKQVSAVLLCTNVKAMSVRREKSHKISSPASSPGNGEAGQRCVAMQSRNGYVVVEQTRVCTAKLPLPRLPFAVPWLPFNSLFLISHFSSSLLY